MGANIVKRNRFKTASNFFAPLFFYVSLQNFFQMEILFIGGLGTGEILLIVLVILLLFGGKKLPELMRGMGRGVKEFKDAMEKPIDDKEKDETKKREVKMIKNILERLLIIN